MTCPTLYLLGELRLARMVLRDAIEQECDSDMIAVLEGDVANIVEGLFDGGEVDRPVRLSFSRDSTVPTMATLAPEWRTTIVRCRRELDWLAWGGDEWPPFRDIDYGIALDSPLHPSAIGERRRLDPGVRPLPHAINLDGMAPGQTTHFEFTHPAQAVEIERHANGWHVVGVTRVGSNVAHAGSEQTNRNHVRVRFAPGFNASVYRIIDSRGERPAPESR